MSRRTWTLTAAAALAVVAVTGEAAGVFEGGRATAAAAAWPAAGTAPVQKRTLSATVSQSGILTYRARADGSPYTVINRAHGDYTKLPAVGQVITQGHVLYRVSDSPVVLLDGSTPAYRTMAAGTTGPDVAELNADLVALGYATRAQLSPSSDTFGSATETALEKLQTAMGMFATGTLTPGQVVFEPTTLRVTALSAAPGATAGPGQPLLLATSTARQVQVALDAAQQTDVAVGNKVTITLPDNQTTPGVVTEVASVATCPPSSGSGGSDSSSAAAETDSCPSGTSSPTINVDVAFSNPAASGKWDQAPVRVGITTGRVQNALTVPVAALLAQSGGGYSVEVIGRGGTRRLVPVSLGLFDDAAGLVQVTGGGLAAGQQVVVPST